MRIGRRHLMKNPQAEADQFQRRALIGFIGIAVALAGLCFGYFRLQVLHHEEYRTRSEANRIKPRPVVPARGLIYDRNGKLIADNVPAYRLEVVPDQTGDLKATLAALNELIGLSPEELQQFQANRKAIRSFRPVVLKLRLTEEQRARLAVNRHRFPGVDVVPYLTRRYPHGDLFAHVVGYVGRLDADDLEALGDSKFSALTHVGKSGLERKYEDRLRGEIGYENVEQNVEGRVLRVVNNVPSLPGADLQLSIDADLQQAAVTAFGDRDGAAVAVDTRTGEVLAMVSLPQFNPNLFVNGISHKDYNALTTNMSRPLFDRNLHGGTPPGSTIKPFVGLAGLESGLRRPSDRILSTGTFRIRGKGRGFGDSHAHGHGYVDLKESIAQSVNTYYYQLALDMGVEKFDMYMDRYGFGRPTGIDLIGETSGILPSPEFKRTRFQQPWYQGDIVNAGIGQGMWKATLLQLSQATASVANNGVRHRLHLLRATRQGFAAPWLREPQPPEVRISTNMANIAAVKEGMVAVVHGPTGTARGIGINSPYLIAGKTGTAQVVSNKNNMRVDPHNLPLHLRHQALFIGYAPADDPRIAVAVVVEHGGFGSTSAAPVAKAIMDAWLLPKISAAPMPTTSTESRP
ncbi:MAG: penicillin-binding protein 2 [Gammaproteobacteria bacterium RIFCSPHIGHO2_12_FULL_63_22]|nr:MAG: penicillin-binding protein 2 [Gammaproteobacteria bacterium RIFCSPHIGHO2_12_FULL_63_22]